MSTRDRLKQTNKQKCKALNATKRRINAKFLVWRHSQWGAVIHIWILFTFHHLQNTHLFLWHIPTYQFTLNHAFYISRDIFPPLMNWVTKWLDRVSPLRQILESSELNPVFEDQFNTRMRTNKNTGLLSKYILFWTFLSLIWPVMTTDRCDAAWKKLKKK